MHKFGQRKAVRWEPLDRSPRAEFKPRRTYLLETHEGTTVTYRSIKATPDELWFWADHDKCYRVERADTRRAVVSGTATGVVSCTVLERR